MTCWRRLAEWTEAGVWPRLHEVLLAELRRANALDFSRAAVDGSHIQALKGEPRLDEAPSIGAGRAANIT
jgi:transposase